MKNLEVQQLELKVELFKEMCQAINPSISILKGRRTEIFNAQKRRNNKAISYYL